MSNALKQIQKQLNGIGKVPHSVICCGTILSCTLLLASSFLLFSQADTTYAREIAIGIWEGGVWIFTESIIGGLLMQSYADRNHRSED